MSHLAYLLLFISVSAGVMGLLTWASTSRAQKRIRKMVRPEAKGDWVKTVVRVIGPFAKLSAPDVKWESSPLRMKFIHAGIRNGSAPMIYFGAKTLLPIVLAGAGYLGLRLAGSDLGRDALLLTLLLPGGTVVYAIIAAVKTNQGEDFRYWLIGDWVRSAYTG